MFMGLSKQLSAFIDRCPQFKWVAAAPDSLVTIRLRKQFPKAHQDEPLAAFGLPNNKILGARPNHFT